MTGLKGAFVGFGAVAEKAHAPALKTLPELRITAVCEAAPARRTAAAACYPEAKIHETLENLLAPDHGLDFVIIATPPAFHGAQALAALKAGCHVLCEKPLTLELSEFEAIRREAAASNLTVFTMHNWAHAPQWKKIFALVEGGALGEVRHAELHTLRTQPAAGAGKGDWRADAGLAGGGILVDHGWHNLYLLHRLLRAAPTRVTARLTGAGANAVEHDAAVFFEFPAATALLQLSWRAALRSNTASIFGTKGVLTLDDDQVVLRTGAGAPERFDFPEKLSAGSAHPDWTAGLLAEFAAATLDPRRRARNLEESDFCFRMISRVYASVRQGRNPLREALSK